MKKVHKVSILGFLIALALILSFIESQIPSFAPIPGIKLGLPNIVIIYLLYRASWKEAAIVSFSRVILVTLLFGSLYTFLYSITGAILSLIVMALLKKFAKLSCVTVSVIGGVVHNIGQIIMACITTSTAQIVYYLPVLLITGTVAGVLIGLIGAQLIKKLDKIKI